MSAGAPFAWQPMQEMHEAALEIYHARVVAMMLELHAALGASGLRKALRPLLSPERLRALAKLIRDYHTSVLVSLGMAEQVEPAEIERLEAAGILPSGSVDVVEDSYLFGQLVAAVRQVGEQRDLSKMSYPEVKMALRERPLPMTDLQRRAIAWAKTSAAVHVTALGDRWASDFSRAAVESDADLRRQHIGQLRDITRENIERGQSVRKLASDMAEASGGYERDFARIAITEKQAAFNNGYADQLVESEGPPQGIYVAKIPAGDACPACVKLHLTAGIGSRPRVFTLSELISNGSNVGRKQAEWKAIVSPTHPHCFCVIQHIPDGWAFEQEPREGENVKKVEGRDAWLHPDGRPWRPRLLPEPLRRGDGLKRDLIKSFMRYRDVPQTGCVVRIHDPEILAECDKVIAQTPAWLFNKDVGVTLVTWDHPRSGVPLEDHDLAYWTGNEIRLSHHVTPDKVGRVLRHEFGHAPNVYLVRQMGGEDAVRRWHQQVYDVAKEEGFVSAYASTAPIECAAEATRLYLYDRKRLMLDYPRQHAELWRAYGALEKRPHADPVDGRVPARAQPEPEWAAHASRRFAN
jgi:hypothetical protein